MAAGVMLKTPMIVKLVTMPSFILVGGLEHGLHFSIQLGMSSSQMANSIIFHSNRSTTSQYNQHHLLNLLLPQMMNISIMDV